MGDHASSRFLAIVTARGGSKGLPRKNVLSFAGRPLIAHTIRAALDCPRVTRCIVSTDDAEIAAASHAAGAEVMERPEHLARDDSSSVDVVLHVLAELEALGTRPDRFALLQPTSPLRGATHLDECLRVMEQSHARCVISVTEMEHHPVKCLLLDDGGTLAPVRDVAALAAPRQALAKAYRQNGAIYAMESQAFIDARAFFAAPAVPYVMSAAESVDIDTQEDFLLAERLFRNRRERS